MKTILNFQNRKTQKDLFVVLYLCLFMQLFAEPFFGQEGVIWRHWGFPLMFYGEYLNPEASDASESVFSYQFSFIRFSLNLLICVVFANCYIISVRFVHKLLRIAGERVLSSTSVLLLAFFNLFFSVRSYSIPLDIEESIAIPMKSFHFGVPIPSRISPEFVVLHNREPAILWNFLIMLGISTATSIAVKIWRKKCQNGS